MYTFDMPVNLAVKLKHLFNDYTADHLATILHEHMGQMIINHTKTSLSLARVKDEIDEARQIHEETYHTTAPDAPPFTRDQQEEAARIALDVVTGHALAFHSESATDVHDAITEALHALLHQAHRILAVAADTQFTPANADTSLSPLQRREVDATVDAAIRKHLDRCHLDAGPD